MADKGTLLITGGAGYIGSHTVKHLLAGGEKIVVLDNLIFGHREALPLERVTFVKIAGVLLFMIMAIAFAHFANLPSNEFLSSHALS